MGTSVLILFLCILASLIASVLVVSACILSAHISQTENLAEKYDEVDNAVQPQIIRRSFSS